MILQDGDYQGLGQESFHFRDQDGELIRVVEGEIPWEETEMKKI